MLSFSSYFGALAFDFNKYACITFRTLWNPLERQFGVVLDQDFPWHLRCNNGRHFQAWWTWLGTRSQQSYGLATSCLHSRSCTKPSRLRTSKEWTIRDVLGCKWTLAEECMESKEGTHQTDTSQPTAWSWGTLAKMEAVSQMKPWHNSFYFTLWQLHWVL